jgi:hypothetical protein
LGIADASLPAIGDGVEFIEVPNRQQLRRIKPLNHHMYADQGGLF